MERYKVNSNYQIVNISRSNEPLTINEDSDDDVKISFLPYLVLDVKNVTATTILTSQFMKKDKTPLTNKLTVQVSYKFSKSLPVTEEGFDKVIINNHEDFVAIFDTSIGVFRGILFEWLNGSILQHPLPSINVKEFLKRLKISFSK